MTNLNIWNEISNIKGRTLKTLDRQKPFEIFAIKANTVIILPHETRKERPIPRANFENAYRRLVATGEITRSEIMAEFSEFNPAYIAAILAELPGVEHSMRPIKLWITR